MTVNTSSFNTKILTDHLSIHPFSTTIIDHPEHRRTQAASSRKQTFFIFTPATR
jgi:hypothetical protein